MTLNGSRGQGKPGYAHKSLHVIAGFPYPLGGSIYLGIML